MKHLTEEQLILFYYGEGEAALEVSDHLSNCEACGQRFHSLQRVLSAVETAHIPERPANYGSVVWHRLLPILPECRQAQWGWLRVPSRWAAAGAMAALLLGAFFLGRHWDRPVNDMASVAPPDVRERILLDSVGDHLERSQFVLMEFMNSSDNGNVDISAQQPAAEELLNSNRLYRLEATRAGEVGMASVLEELEKFLIEIARAPSSVSGTELADIQRRIDTQGVLFKIRVAGSQLRERERAAARELARRTS